MLRIRRSEEGATVTFFLSGRIEENHVLELQALIDGEKEDTPRAFDLEKVRLVDRDVVKFLADSEAKGVQLKNCPAYVREWIDTGRV